MNDTLKDTDIFLRQDRAIYELFVKYVQYQDKIHEEYDKALKEKNNLKLELHKREEMLNAYKEKLATVNKVIENEKSHLFSISQVRDNMKNILAKTVNILSEKNKNIPNNVIEAILKLNENSQEIISDSSDLELTSSCASVTDSDEWHLFPDLGKYSKLNNIKNNENGVVDSFDTNQKILFKRYSQQSTDSAISSILCESDDSNKSNLFLFLVVIEKFKSRPHDLKYHTSVMPEKCIVCDLKVGCGRRILKCCECRVSAHDRCAEKLLKPCIPMKPLVSKTSHSIADYCSVTKPYIPAIIVHCLLQIEERGLNEAALYKLPVYDSQTRSLKEKVYKNKGVPNLSVIPINIICTFILDFFASLKPALISTQVFNKCIRYFQLELRETVKFADIFNILVDLDVYSKNTFVFLIMHLQKVASSKNSKMSPRSLSKVFSPILIEKFMHGSYEENKLRFNVLEKLIKMPIEFWASILVNAF